MNRSSCSLFSPDSALLCHHSAQQGFYFAEKAEYMGIRYYYKNGKTAPYGDTLLRIRRNGKYGLVDFEGRTIIPPRYDVLTNHFAQFNIIGRRGRYGLLNRQGGWAQPLRYDVILPVNQRGTDRLACIRRHKIRFL